jgi:hypothetical protein
MKRVMIALVVALGGLTACQSVPAERENNCVCNWEALTTQGTPS